MGTARADPTMACMSKSCLIRLDKWLYLQTSLERKCISEALSILVHRPLSPPLTRTARPAEEVLHTAISHTPCTDAERRTSERARCQMPGIGALRGECLLALPEPDLY